jgi:16S rRNA (guanine1516-N2)-methyltransferase
MPVTKPVIAVVVESEDEGVARAASALARRLKVELERRAKPQAAGDELVLALNDWGLELRDMDARPGHGLSVDFSTLHPRQAARRGGFSRKQLLARAIGRHTHTIIDATAGLGHDAALLACMGFQVIAVERSPIIFALLEDGLRRAMNDEALRQAFGGRLTILNHDAREVFREFSADAIYIDPMFPPKRKSSALAKKEIRMVRQIVGDDEDAADLFEHARRHAGRIVVKRPTYAPPLAQNPTTSISGKLVRYDVYIAAAAAMNS